jgi:YegS/Rv2252/BmrU family lipid kinase
VRAFYIVNPVSGGGKGLRTWRRIEGYLSRRGLPAEGRLTDGPGAATELAIQARQKGYELVVGVGGDGTIQEVVNGLIDSAGRCPAVLGVVPGGTGNDFSKMLGYPSDPEGALDVILGGEVRLLDVGRLTDRYFINIAGVGFDAEVAGFLNQRPKRLPAALTYIYGVLVMLFRYRPAEMTLELDEETVIGKCLLVSVCNGHSHAGGMRMAPEARPDDGILDICVAGDLGRLETVLLLPKVFKGRHTLHPKVKLYKTRKIGITSSQPLVLQADGEVLGRTPAKIDLVPGVLQVMGARRPA